MLHDVDNSERGIMNLELLNKTIDESGLRKTHIANCIGMTKGQLYAKCIGTASWRVDEAKAISEVLKLTNKQRNDIFFS